MIGSRASFQFVCPTSREASDTDTHIAGILLRTFQKLLAPDGDFLKRTSLSADETAHSSRKFSAVVC